MAPAAALLLLTGCTDGATGVQGKPGAAGVRDPYFPKLGNGGYDVQHYALTLDVDPDTGRLKGTAEITARATQDLSAFNLDLHGMTVDGATVDGEKAAANRAGDELTLRPHRDLDKGRTFRTVVRYSGVPKTITDDDDTEEGWLKTADGALAVGEPTGSMAWFPGNHHPSDKATYDITVTVPKELEAISNGELKSRRTKSEGAKGERTTFAWHTGEPMASYLATLAIGDYRVKASRTPAGLPVLTAADPAVAGRSAALLARIPEIMEWGTENFGPYPFSSTGAIVVPDGEVGYALETQNRPVFPEGQFDTETLVHELAHQWYGNSVTPESWKDMWLNEGFATYAEWIWAEDFEDVPAQKSFDKEFAKADNWAFPPADPPTAADISESPVYGRGAMVLHKVRQAVGDDAFYEILQGWAKKNRHANASTDDFTAYVEEKAGKDLTGLWDTWLYGKDKPEQP
ncbi:M1 family metallopeptidase [Streptomyces sp. NBC_01142]|uniref:M1 family metallopeptidase n=1 Tax=Streptomyces sp. NBC_01142 TaxID=2975865 RepID=UPI0022525B3C|nr:M1 family metallopeptidase [Streptomyces sp. NBC_01142]MCX4824006.1 M1 family metallopeptidase [Streptomyces sp. NBC_01142]